MSDLEEKVKKSTEVEAVLDRALEVYQDRLGFSIKRVRGNGYWMNSAVFLAFVTRHCLRRHHVFGSCSFCSSGQILLPQ